MNSFIAGSVFCPGLPNREPTDFEKRLRVYKSSAMMARHAWRVDKALAKTHKNRQKLRVYTASDANWLINVLKIVIVMSPVGLYMHVYMYTCMYTCIHVHVYMYTCTNQNVWY